MSTRSVPNDDAFTDSGTSPPSEIDPDEVRRLLKGMPPTEAVGKLTAKGASIEDAEVAVKAALNEVAAHREQRAAGGKFGGRKASTVQRRSIEWLWERFLPLGALSLLYGPEGDGKSVFTAMIAAQVTLGMLPGELEGKPAHVEIIAFEDDAEAVLRPDSKRPVPSSIA